LVLPNIANPYFADIALGSQHYARQHDYNVFLCNTGWDPVEELHVLNTLAAQQVDGIILHGARCSDELLHAFTANFRPLILCGREFEGPGVSTSATDDAQGATLAFEYLISRGHTAIGLLVGEKTPSTMSNARRLAGYRQAAMACGLSIDEDWIVHGALTAPGGHESALKLLRRAPRLTAILAHNDIVAIGAIKACQELGLRVPEDVAVVGFSDIDLASQVTPALTTVRVDRYGSGQEVMTRMLEMIQAPEEAYPPIITPADKLIIRDSA
jgi:LacI family transcriptional regulator